jgi:hypothetical protein
LARSRVLDATVVLGSINERLYKSHKVGTYGTIVLVFGFVSLVVLAILLGALVVTV